MSAMFYLTEDWTLIGTEDGVQAAVMWAAAEHYFITRDKEFLDRWVYGCKDHFEYIDKLGASRLLNLKTVQGFGYRATDEDIAKGESVK